MLKTYYLPLLVAYFFQTNNVSAQKPLDFENEKIKVRFETAGSAVSEFILKSKPLNPLSWTLQPKDMPKPNQGAPVFRGHFLCTGRWGAASAEEQMAGIPHNGEVNTQNWKVLKREKVNGNLLGASLLCKLPKEQMTVERKIQIHPSGNAFFVTEKCSSLTDLDRLFNLVQHPTIGAPFLNPQTVIDCNGTAGFDQRTGTQDLEKKVFYWPNGELEDGACDLRKVNDDRGYVTTHIFPDSVEWGWVTASSPNTELVLGYIFKAKAYPWLNLWHWKKDGVPHAHGLEFGTTGKGLPYPELLAQGGTSFFGKNSFVFLPARQSITKSYLAFLGEIPKDFSGVARIDWNNDKIILTEQAPRKRKIEILVGKYDW